MHAMFFENAKSVWLKDLAGTPNIQARFKCSFTAGADSRCTINIAARTFYRLKFNGRFLAYGPARAPHGYLRVDHMELPVAVGINELSIELSGYYVSSFYSFKQPSFVVAEIFEGGKSICATDIDGDFTGYRVKARQQNVPRYSIQRGFMEIYDFSQPEVPFELDQIDMGGDLLERGVPLPGTTVCEEVSIRCGRLERCPQLPQRQFCKDDKGRIDYIDSAHRDLYKSLELSELTAAKAVTEQKNVLKSGEFLVCDFRKIKTGFLKMTTKAEEDSELLLVFDEKLLSGTIKVHSVPMNNLVCCRIPAGRVINFESFECYSQRYLLIIVISGRAAVSGIGVREYVMGDAVPEFDSGSKALNDIYSAAVETLRQNTLDVFMDCPGRERAGWLCDSYFTAQSCLMLTGNISYERVFMENYARAKYFDGLPEGMLPMCYPADVLKSYIPQWAMWYVLELEEYLQRDPQSDKMLFRDRCCALWDFLKNYRNADGLLERLPGWNFIEWSQANDWMQDVHYPTNMLYARMLEIIATLYDDKAAAGEAIAVRDEVMKQSFDGRFFIDNAVRNEANELVITGNCSEVCQYYAYFLDFASPSDSRFDHLGNIILNVCGPGRKEKKIMPELAYANAFIGNFLRLTLLMRFGRYEQALREVELYFAKMAELTGTLWENDSIEGSLNHGFASFAAVVIKRCTEQLNQGCPKH